MPRFPQELKSTLVKPTEVEVKVTIDSRGRVIQAEPVTPKGTQVLLIGAAVTAARSWKFRPATVNGLPVEGEAQLKFVFTPGK